MTAPARGHRLVPHTADLIVESWAPTRAGCLEEAVLGLVDAFVDRRDAVATRSTALAIPGTNDADVVVALLEQAIYSVEVDGDVPVEVHLRDGVDGGVDGEFRLVALNQVEVTGSAPKGVSRHALHIGRDAQHWSCRVIVDV